MKLAFLVNKCVFFFDKNYFLNVITRNLTVSDLFGTDSENVCDLIYTDAESLIAFNQRKICKKKGALFKIQLILINSFLESTRSV